MINSIKRLLSSKDKLSEHGKVIKAIDNMKATRFWALWLIGILIALAVLIGAIAPEGLYFSKSKPPTFQQSYSPADIANISK